MRRLAFNIASILQRMKFLTKPCAFAFLAATLAWLGSALECRQDFGRPCTDHEHSHPYLSPTLTGDISFLTSNNALTSDTLTKHAFKWAASAPHAVVSYNASLVALFGLTGWCTTNCGDMCPDHSIHAYKTCQMAANAGHSFHFVGHSKVNNSLGIDGEVDAAPFDPLFNLTDRRPNVASGMHCMRVFAWDGCVYAILRDNSKQAYGMLRRVLPSSASKAVELQARNIILSIGQVHEQKPTDRQWTPIDQIDNTMTGHVDYLFARRIDPHQIVQCSHDGQCIDVASTSNSAFFIKKFKTMSPDGFSAQMQCASTRTTTAPFSARHTPPLTEWIISLT